MLLNATQTQTRGPAWLFLHMSKPKLQIQSKKKGREKKKKQETTQKPEEDNYLHGASPPQLTFHLTSAKTHTDVKTTTSAAPAVFFPPFSSF